MARGFFPPYLSPFHPLTPRILKGREMVYSIRNWEENFENNRTRDMKSMSWVPIPTTMGDAYLALVDRPDGAALFGAWIACVEVAARCKERGTLMRDNGEPHTPATLSRLTHMPEKLIAKMLEICQKDPKWIEAAGKPQEGAGCLRKSVALGNPRESEGTLLQKTMPGWRSSFEDYQTEARQALADLLADSAWMKSRRAYHANLDIPKSLQKAWDDFWMTEAGWQNKKRKRSKTIDWKRTAANALTQRMNQVWLPRGAEAPTYQESKPDCPRSEKRDGVTFRCTLKKGHDGPHDMVEMLSPDAAAGLFQARTM